jgi:hypothetical protein
MPWSASVLRRVAHQDHWGEAWPGRGGVGGRRGLPAFELEGSGERKSIQPSRGGAGGAAEESGPSMLVILGTGVKGGLQGVCTGLGGVLGDRALRLRDYGHGI